MGRKRSNGDQPIGVGLTAKQMRRKKPINSDYLVDIEPITENQKILFMKKGRLIDKRNTNEFFANIKDSHISEFLTLSK